MSMFPLRSWLATFSLISACSFMVTCLQDHNKILLIYRRFSYIAIDVRYSYLHQLCSKNNKSVEGQ